MSGLSPEREAELDRVREQRDAFCDRVDILTAVAKSNRRHVRELLAELDRVRAERDALKADFDTAIKGFNASAMEIFELRERVAEPEPPGELVVYRAEYAEGQIPLGLYTTREAAREHCETNVRREEPEGSIRGLSWWTEDVADDDAAYELYITPAEVGGLIRGTGYVVTPLTVASVYGAEADE